MRRFRKEEKAGNKQWDGGKGREEEKGLVRSEGRNLRVGERRERNRERIMRGEREGTQGEMKRKEK